MTELRKVKIERPDGKARFHFCETKDPRIFQLEAQAVAFSYIGRYSKVFLEKILKQLKEGEDKFLNSKIGFTFGVKWSYDLDKLGDGDLSTFYFEIDQSENGIKFYWLLREALERIVQMGNESEKLIGLPPKKNDVPSGEGKGSVTLDADKVGDSSPEEAP